MKAIVIGASGFGRETLDVSTSKGTDTRDIGVLDDSPSDANLRRLMDLDITYLGTVDEWIGRSTF